MLDRRGFLKFVGGAGVGILATPVLWKSTDDMAIWSQNWSWVPDPAKGDPTFATTISKLCPSGQGIKVRLLGGRPVTVHGDPSHPLSQGALNALCAAEVQVLHSPARLRQPHKRGSNGKPVPISWDEASTMLAEGLKQAKDKGGVYAVSGDPTSVINDVLSALTNKGQGLCFLMPGEEQAARRAWKLMNGLAANSGSTAGNDIGRLGYDMEHSDMVLAIGANVLESWGPIVRNRRAWSAGRPQGAEPAFRLAYASALQDNTAVVADWWLPMRGGQELVVALGVAHLLARAGRTVPAADASAFLSLIAAWTPEKVEAATGVPAKKLEAVAEALLRAKRPLVIVGSPLGQGGAAAPIMAGVACNLLLGNLNAEGGLRILPHAPAALPGASGLDVLLDNDLMAWVQGIGQGRAAPGACIFYEANPVYALPGGAAPLMEKAGFTVALTSFMDETAARCDLLLPAAMGLERWDDAETPYGVGSAIYSLAIPVAEPQYEGRPVGDVLLDVGRRLGFIAAPTIADMVGLLKVRAAQLKADWTDLSNGLAHVVRTTLTPGALVLGAKALAEAAQALAASDGLCLVPTTRHGVGTPESGIPPYSVKLVGPRDVYKNQSMLHLSGATAAKLGVSNGNVVTVTGPGGTCRACVLIDEGLCPGTVSMLYGMGHTAFDAFSRDKGSNLLQLAAPTAEAGTGLSVWGSITVKVAKV